VVRRLATIKMGAIRTAIHSVRMGKTCSDARRTSNR
jgi:hypothetical protein